MSNFNGQDGMRAVGRTLDERLTFDEVAVEDDKAYAEKGIEAQAPKIQELKKDKDGYHPVRTDNEWREMYNNLHEGWKTDLFELRESNNTKELKIIDSEIDGLKIAILFSQRLLKEKEKYRTAVIQMREDNQSISEYQDKEYEEREQMGYKYCVEKGECRIVEKEN